VIFTESYSLLLLNAVMMMTTMMNVQINKDRERDSFILSSDYF
jgi:hypothetical protein